MDVLQSLFNPQKMCAIQQIPLSVIDHEDSWMWKFDSKGIYTLKSGYKYQYNQLPRAPTLTKDLWRYVWKLELPAKVLNFLWQALSNILPICMNLIHRYVAISGLCLVCNHEPETVLHCLITYPFARDCWVTSNVG
ncbi:hypothetical protein P3X46_013800 [Hevea brasiliensis]|uniref:Reverse transcriptase zinc-binding domain-containing protein n=1 Tax=Hevea brasiliensis TaxID=3981 RepID=A0ABQ9M8H7_HEVBR|nr:hypothetical protein P3X46_013800 [Hevea brasiliensis]